MWVVAHELECDWRNTLVMPLHRPTLFPAKAGATGTSNELEQAGSDRVEVISEWCDGTTLSTADLTGELAGKKVIPLIGHDGQAALFEQGVSELLASSPGTPGFLFIGDDGDSLWFWPDGEPVAFRFDPEAAEKLRGMLIVSVSRLLSQGALVFCHEERDLASGDPVFHFPELGLRAA
jgi:hypothetical protein